MKAVIVNFLGQERYLAFTGRAMFRLLDEFGGMQELLEQISPETNDGLSALCKAVCILAEEGELGRRALGYDKSPIADWNVLFVTISPKEMAILKSAIPKAIELGYLREIEPENNEIDLGLAEINQKKTKN